MILQSLVSQLMRANELRSAPPVFICAKPGSRRQTILAMINEGRRAFTADEVAEKVGASTKVVTNAMCELRAEGHLKSIGKAMIGGKIMTLFCAFSHTPTAKDIARMRGDTGEKILMILADADCSTSQLATKIGITVQTVRNWMIDLRSRGDVDYDMDHTGQRRIWRLAK